MAPLRVSNGLAERLGGHRDGKHPQSKVPTTDERRRNRELWPRIGSSHGQSPCQLPTGRAECVRLHQLLKSFERLRDIASSQRVTYFRGGVWIGDRCIVGTNTEIKRAILLPHAKAPHLNYVGDSILGADVNLGAGTVLSNFRHDGEKIHIPAGGARFDSGRRKLGAILGDGVLTGCNCVLHPGCIVGRGTQIYPGVQLRAGIYPAGSLVKLKQDLEIVPQA